MNQDDKQNKHASLDEPMEIIINGRKENACQMHQESTNHRKAWCEIGKISVAIMAYIAIVCIVGGFYYSQLHADTATSSDDEIRRHLNAEYGGTGVRPQPPNDAENAIGDEYYAIAHLFNQPNIAKDIEIKSLSMLQILKQKGFEEWTLRQIHDTQEPKGYPEIEHLFKNSNIDKDTPIGKLSMQGLDETDQNHLRILLQGGYYDDEEKHIRFQNYIRYENLTLEQIYDKMKKEENGWIKLIEERKTKQNDEGKTRNCRFCAQNLLAGNFREVIANTPPQCFFIFAILCIMLFVIALGAVQYVNRGGRVFGIKL